MLKVDFVEGEDIGDGVYTADFGADDDGREFLDYRGMHYAMGLKKHPWMRESYIYVVRQHDLWKTLRVLAHELTHAAIWLLHLPAKWSKALDGETHAI